MGELPAIVVEESRWAASKAAESGYTTFNSFVALNIKVRCNLVSNSHVFACLCKCRLVVVPITDEHRQILTSWGWARKRKQTIR